MWKLAFFHTLDSGSRWATRELPLKLVDRFRSALRQDLDCPVREISGHSGEPQAQPGAPDEPAESNTLHHSANKEARPRHLPSSLGLGFPPARPADVGDGEQDEGGHD